MNAINADTQRFTIGEFGTGLSYSQFSYSDLVLSDTLLTRDKKLKVSVNVKNTGSREGKETVLWFISDEVGTYNRPVKQLKYFEKQFLLPGEMKEMTFTIDPAVHLSYPDENGKMMLEDGYFKILVGPQEARFELISD
jgi:beta-glucosidase